MDKNRNKETKELYRQLRTCSCQELWEVEVPRFERASAAERMERVALVRALGVVFSETGTEDEKARVRTWLMGLLKDPQEKIRRYAMAALPKLGAGTGEENALLDVFKNSEEERERKFVARSLDKIGGSSTLRVLAESGAPLQTEQKVRAHVARDENPTTVLLDRRLEDFSGVKIHLRGRRGLEAMVRTEAEALLGTTKKFRVGKVFPGLVELIPTAPFSLGDVYRLRCFGTLNFVLGTASGSDDARYVEQLAGVITSPVAQKILTAFTDGAIRYRLEFVEQGARRGLVRQVISRAYALCPTILNDPRQSPWAVDVHPGPKGESIELRPRFSPDPRLRFRQQDVPAASHPPLAAAMARLAGPWDGEVVWDPFCGSGLELVERALLGNVRLAVGTDLSAEAIEISGRNFESAGLGKVGHLFLQRDFRDHARIPQLGKGKVSLVLSNPPMGMRVPIPDLRGLIQDLFRAAATVLQPGGRLVFANPVKMDSPERGLRLESRQVVDFGGFNARMEKYIRI